MIRVILHLTLRRCFQGQVEPRLLGTLTHGFRQAHTQMSLQQMVLQSSCRHLSLSSCRNAKGKDKKKDKKTVVRVNEQEMAELIDVEKLRSELDGVLESLKENYMKQLLLRTSIGSIETLSVPFDGDEYPLNELAQVTRKSPTLLVVNSATFPEAAGDIVRAVQTSGLGLNPQQEGTTIYIQIPKVTREHRESLAKGAKAAFNAARDRLKEIQNRTIKYVKHRDGVSEDLVFRVQSQVTALTDQFVANAEKLYKAKSAELLAEK